MMYSMALTIGHVIDNLTQGGAQTLLKDIIVRSPDDVEHAVCVLGSDMTLASEFRELDVTLHACNGSFRFDPTALYSLFRYLSNDRFDIVHAHLAYAQAFTRLFGRLVGSECVISTYHDVPQTYCRDRHMRLLETLTRPLDTVSVGVSSSVAMEFEKTFHFNRGGEMQIIENGIDVESFRARIADADGDQVRTKLGLDDDLIFLNVGRLAPKKRQRDLIDAMALFDKQDRDGHLVLVGGGELEHDLHDRVSRKGVQDRVTVAGRVPSVDPYYAAADIYVHAALYEGWPLTLAEALTAELPVIATDVPGTEDVVGDAGVIVPPCSPDRLASSMADLVDPDRRTVLADRSRQKADGCRIERTVDGYIQLYRRLAT
jgi:glycosyltransferase involved in cell wall biosynthesis